MSTPVVSPPAASLDPQRTLLRHMLATLAYRAGKALRGSPPGFGEMRVEDSLRSPGEILAHMGDLLDWGLSLAGGEKKWHAAAPLPWEQEVARFFAALAAFDGWLASGAPCAVPAEKLFQGPIADSFQHVGQIAMLRRMAGKPVRGENYFRADIAAGRVGAEQAPPGLEFD
jgi:hypothetical protein